jgi:hypothetical protein
VPVLPVRYSKDLVQVDTYMCGSRYSEASPVKWKYWYLY